jgi:hypothetical protein
VELSWHRIVDQPNIPTEDRITQITKDTISSETISGDKIEGGTITGITIKSSGTYKDDNKDVPIWEISPDGSGHLAKGNISWGVDGTVSLTSSVKIGDDNITTIDGDKIRTGSIDASRINVGSLSVVKLDTRQTSSNDLNISRSV